MQKPARTLSLSLTATTLYGARCRSTSMPNGDSLHSCQNSFQLRRASRRSLKSATGTTLPNGDSRSNDSGTPWWRLSRMHGAQWYAAADQARRADFAAYCGVRYAAPPLRPSRVCQTVLEKLAPSFRLVLLTKGEYELQNRRIAESGLRGVFERAMIVDHKDAGAFRQLVAELKVNPRLAWSVGDSLRSDIRPALAAGLRAVWVHKKRVDPMKGRTRWRTGTIDAIRSLRELPRLLGDALKEMK